MQHTVISARLEGDLAQWFEDTRWNDRCNKSTLVRKALEQYRDWRNGISPVLDEHEVQLQSARLITQQVGHCNIPLIQRKLRISYLLAEKLVAEMTERGWVAEVVSEDRPDVTPDITTS
jgi:hypothetical protein